MLIAIPLILMLVGLFGLIVPMFPGILVIWLTALGFGIFKGFSLLGGILFVGITLLMLLGMVIDNLVMGMMIRKEGAAWSSFLLAMVAGLVGTILVPPVGGLIAAPTVVLLLEYRRARNWKNAWQIVRGMALGWSLSFVLQFGIGLVMVLLWGLWAWRG
jgi:uncharacterized protein YqgC (DUF456 family)